MAGTKELEEIIDFALGDVAPLVVSTLKDGVQFSDGLAFYEAVTKNEAFKAHMIAAWENKSLALAEVQDLDLGEGINLGMRAASHVPKILAALK